MLTLTKDTVNFMAYGGQIIRIVGVKDMILTCGALQFHVTVPRYSATVPRYIKPLLGLPDRIKLGFVHLGGTCCSARGHRAQRV